MISGSAADVRPADPMEEARRTLMDYVRRLPLHAFFGRVTLKLAETLATRSASWHPPLAWFQPDGSNAQALQCEMGDAGDRLQCVTVYLYALFGEETLESHCSCAVERCVHAAALLIRLQQLLDWPRAMTPLQRWQQCTAVRRELPAVLSASTPSHEVWQLLCLLGLDEASLPARLTARLVLARGADARRWFSVEQVQARPYVSREALLWQAQLAMTQSRRARQPDFILTGERAPNCSPNFSGPAFAGMPRTCRRSASPRRVFRSGNGSRIPAATAELPWTGQRIRMSVWSISPVFTTSIWPAESWVRWSFRAPPGRSCA